VINEFLRSQLVDLGQYALTAGIFRGYTALNAGLGMVVVALIGLFGGTLGGARLIAPGHSGEAAMLTLMWSVLGESFLMARTLGHLDTPGPLAALGAFVLGLMLSATHLVLRTSWPVSLALIIVCGGLGGLFGTILGEFLKMLNAI
jgi:hypothetical protein